MNSKLTCSAKAFLIATVMVVSALLLFPSHLSAQADFGAVAFVSPKPASRLNTSAAYTSSQQVTIRLTNYGTVTSATIPVGFDFDNGTTTGTGTYTAGNVFQGDTVSYTFSTNIDPSAVGTYTLKTWTAFPGETNVANDTTYLTIKLVDNPTVSVPWFQGFEAMPNATYQNDVFAFPQLQSMDFYTQHQGEGRIRTAPFVHNGVRALTYDRSPAVAYTTVNKTIFTLDMSDYAVGDALLLDFWWMDHANLEGDSSGIYVRGGDSEDWQEVFLFPSDITANGVWNHETEFDLDQILDDDGQDYSQSFQLMIVQEDDAEAASPTGADGISIDDILIYQTPVFDFAVTEVILPVDTPCGFGPFEQVKVVISNEGDGQVNPGSSLNVGYKVGNNPAVVEAWSLPVTMAPGDTIHYTFSTLVDMSATATYVFKMWSGLLGDDQPFNDTLYNYTLINTGVSGAPNVDIGPDTVICAGTNITLDAGAGYAGYLWSTLSPTQTILVNAPGTYYVAVQATNGCYGGDSITITSATYLYDSTSVTICPGQSWFAGGAMQTTAGVYNDTLIAGGGCDTVLTTMLSLATISQDTVMASICTGDSVMAAGMWQTTTGFYHDTATGSNGCDSITVTNLMVNPLPTLVVSNDTTVCYGDSAFAIASGAVSYVWWAYDSQIIDSVPAISGTIDTTLLWITVYGTDGNGCVSVDTVAVSTFPITVVDLGNDTSSCAGSCVTLDAGSGGVTYMWSTGATGQTISACSAGTYMVTCTDANGCEATDAVDLTINPTYSTTDTITICTGDSANIGGTWQSTAGVYTDSSLTAAGCDSVTTVTLMVSSVLTSNTATTICTGDSVFAGGAWQTASGTYVDSLASSGGCDSVATTVVTVVNAYVDSVDVILCPGDSVFAGGSWLTSDTTVVDMYTSAGGCDSLVYTVVDAFGFPNIQIPNTDFCDGESLTIGLPPFLTIIEWSDGSTAQTLTVTTAGDYWVIAQTPIGCQDTIFWTSDVFVLPNVTATATPAAICPMDTTTLAAAGAATYVWAADPSLFSTTGASVMANPDAATTYTVTGTDANGCAADGVVSVAMLPAADCVDFIGELPLGVEVNAYLGTGEAIVLNMSEGGNGTYRVAVYNAMGQLVHSESLVKTNAQLNHRIDISDRSTGLYIVLVNDNDNRQFTKKLFKP